MNGSRIRTRLQRVLDGRRAHMIALVLAALVALPTVFQGLQIDDHLLRLSVVPHPDWPGGLRSPFDLFTFVDGTPAHNRPFVERGLGPWWADLSARIAFFRPLSSLTHWLDFRMWPNHPGLMHAHSCLWYLALVGAVGALFRQTLSPRWIAALAAVLYAVDYTHGQVVEWIANRNALIASTFGVLSVVLQHRALKERRTSLTLWSAVALAAGLTGGEGALGVVGYLLALAVCLGESASRKRIRAFVPHIAVLILWAFVYRLGAYGVRGSGFYADPGRQPLAFIEAGLHRLPLLLSSEVFFPPDLYIFFPPHVQRVYLAIVFVALALFAVVVAPFFRARTSEQRVRVRTARFFAVGAVLSAIPCVGVYASARLMLLPGIGILGLLALAIQEALNGANAWPIRPQRWLALGLTGWLVVGHLCLSPFSFQIASHSMMLAQKQADTLAASLGNDLSLRDQWVFVVNAPDAVMNASVQLSRVTSGQVCPRGIVPLAIGIRPLEVERRDERTLVVRAVEGFYRSGTDMLLRSPDSPIAANERFDFPSVTVEVAQSGAEGIPTEAIFQFHKPLEDRSLRFVEWRNGTLQPFELPPVGGRRRIAPQMLRL